MLPLRTFFLMIILFSSALNAVEKDREVHLKKDVFERVRIETGTLQHILEFRWSLYSNGVLVLHKSFDQRVSQHTLRLNHTNQGIRIKLMPQSGYKTTIPYIFIHFKSFDFEKNEAVFTIRLNDNTDEIKWEKI